MQVITFGSEQIDNQLSKLSDADIDQLAFGAVQLDGSRTILTYNQAEAQITGRNQDAVIGRNFFTEVAPCTNTSESRAQFDAGVRAGNLNTMFEWLFDYEMRPTKVRVHMTKSLDDDTFWVFVKRI